MMMMNDVIKDAYERLKGKVERLVKGLFMNKQR